MQGRAWAIGSHALYGPRAVGLAVGGAVRVGDGVTGGGPVGVAVEEGAPEAVGFGQVALRRGGVADGGDGAAGEQGGAALEGDGFQPLAAPESFRHEAEMEMQAHRLFIPALGELPEDLDILLLHLDRGGIERRGKLRRHAAFQV